MVETANDETSVTYLTLSVDGVADSGAREEIDEAVRRQGGRTVWRTHSNVARSYALVELPDAHDAGALRALCSGVVYETPIIALAVSPTVPQALPGILDALGGPGRPGGIRSCRPCRGDAGVVVEWDPNVSSAQLVLGLIDVELGRFASGRTTELLSPLPEAVVAKIASDGLRAPEIAPARVLELLIDDA
jgi:hypothetical protein